MNKGPMTKSPMTKNLSPLTYIGGDLNPKLSIWISVDLMLNVYSEQQNL